MMAVSDAPFLIFYLAAFLVGMTYGRLRLAILLATPVLGAINLAGLDRGEMWELSLFGQMLIVTRVDGLSLFFGFLFHLAAFLGIVFALHIDDRLQQIAGLLYAGSALGAIFAGDFLTFLIFCELLALSSTPLILARCSARSTASAGRYLVFHILSGSLLLVGICLHLHETGSLRFGQIGLDGLSSWLIFLAFGVKAGFPFLHGWLTDAYPESTPTGTVFLSAFTTKVGVYALARAYPGTELLIYIGAAAAVFPVFFAVIENDLRRVLSYSLINQIGFMLCGIGLGTPLAVSGAIAHAFNDVVFKGLLFMSMGAVLMRTGKMNASELGGLYRSMPWTTAFCIAGALSISAFPLFSGFVSKSMIMTALLEENHTFIWLLFLFASAGVFHHAGIKIPFFAFFAHDSGIRCREAPANMLVAMGLSAAICLFNGIYPWLLYAFLPYTVFYEPYTAEHVMVQSQLLFFSALAFCTLKLLRFYPPELPGVNLEADWIYRKAAPLFATRCFLVARSARQSLLKYGQMRLGRFFALLHAFYGPGSVIVQSLSTGEAVLWVALLLGGYILIVLLG